MLEPPGTSFAASARPPSAEGGEWEKVGENWYDKNRGLPTLFAEGPKAAKKAVRRAALGSPKKNRVSRALMPLGGRVALHIDATKTHCEAAFTIIVYVNQSQVQLPPRETHRQGGAYEVIAAA